jgi:anti-anti-sigma factor
MDEVEYLNSGFLDVLVRVHKKLKSRNSRLRLGNLDPQIYEVFHATKLDELLDIRKRECGLTKLLPPILRAQNSP